MPLYRLVSFPVFMLDARVHQKVRLCLSRTQPGSESVFEVWLPGRLPTEGNRGTAEVSGGGWSEGGDTEESQPTAAAE